MTDEKDMERIFAKRGIDLGFREVTARYSQECELKVGWRRIGGQIDFWVSDYLRNAPEDVMRDLAETIYSKIAMDHDVPYTPVVLEYLNDPSFVAENQETYVGRLDGLSPGPWGRHKDLCDSLARLEDAGLAIEIPHLFVGWLPMMDSNCIGHSSALMKTVCLTRRLDASFVEDEMLDFCLYSQLAFVSLEYGMPGWERDEKFRDMLLGYPHGSELLGKLRRMGFRMTRDVSPEC
jgi:hypothetical protein